MNTFPNRQLPEASSGEGDSVSAVPISAGQRAVRLLESGDYAAAMETAQAALKQDSSSMDALLVIGELALEVGNRDLAGRMLALARRVAPQDPRVLELLEEMNRPGRRKRLPARLMARARGAVENKDWKLAVDSANAAIKADGSVQGAHAILAVSWRALGQREDALRAAAEALRREPNDANLTALVDGLKQEVSVPAEAQAGAHKTGAPDSPRAAALAPIRLKAPSVKPVGRRICITFGGEVYDGPTAMTVMLAPKFGADDVWVYDDNWIVNHAKDFYDHNRWLWEHHHKRGFGWYAWKPFILLNAMERMNDGDVVLYIDADTFPVNDFSVLYDTCAKDGGIMLFKAGGNVNDRFRQSQWCKRDCFILMNQDSESYYQAEAGVARFMLFQKGQWRAHQFLMEWLTYCVNPMATTFDPSVLGHSEVPGFIEHRTEQAIMTNLAHKYGIKLYREACELGNSFPEDKDLYPQLFSQLNPWGNKTAPCVGSKFRNVT